MRPAESFAKPAAWMGGAHLARVVSVSDPLALARVQVTLLGADSDGDAAIWASVAVPFAADNCGAFLIPDVGDQVLVVFVGQDADSPVVIGSLWNGATSVPETLGGDRVDRWTLTGRAGTRIAIVEAAGGEKVEIETPSGVKATLSDAGGQSLTLRAAGNSITMNANGITLRTGNTVKVEASMVDISAGLVSIDAAFTTVSGIVQCDTLITNSVISTSYTPGAGNIW